ncbi:nuclear intron maturase 1, mitochondrial-like isoform X2 [Hibiscus syriacus]|uniref:nuclear intron maturase 1, mitochondrial-like isoform X2 n=1 Tax=Hibiscus syriacus TaxID=106335 RepID=UPI001923FECA|nr:nuclear intron maturase 1, mitochondrial-like isoform X2 [Hibiscus syriacus]
MSLRQIIKHFPYVPNPKPFPFLSNSLRFSSSSLSILSTQDSSANSASDADPYNLLKQDPFDICLSIWVKSFSSPTNATFPNLSGFLSKLDLWVLAYQRSCAHFTGTFPPRNAIHSQTLNSILSLRNAVVHGSRFKWNNKTNQLIRSPNDKPSKTVISKRKLQAMLESPEPCFQDRVVQEVLLMVLEPIFEARFSDVMMDYLQKVVKDRKVLNLIKSGLNVRVKRRLKRGDDGSGGGDLKSKRRKKRKATKKRILNENEPKPDPYWLRTFFDFAPEEAAKVPSYGYCGILSPLLANVCLNELDQVMEEKIVAFFRPSKHDSIWKDSIDDGCHNPSWPEFVPSSGREKTRKMDYIRFGGHFLIGIRGPREDAVQIRKEIIEFCESKFGLRLDNSKLEIEHISRGIQFLDHIICRRVIHPTLRYTSSGGNIVSQKDIGTLLSVTASLQQCIRQFRRLQFVKGDKDPEPLPCNPMLYSSQAHTNSQMNKFLETVADWYKYADNRKKIVGFCAYVIRSSLAKLYAARYRLKSRAKVYKIASRDLSRPLRESSNNSAPEYSDLLRMGLVDAIEGVQFSHMSLIPSCDYTPFPRNWIPDHEQLLQEYIRLQDPKFFCDLHRTIKREGLSLPQDEISEIVWDYKTLGIRRYRPNSGEETKEGSE